MPISSLEQSSGSVYAPLVTFRWGGDHVERYCRYTEDVIVGYDTFQHVPMLKITQTKPEQGGTEDCPWEVSMPINLEPYTTIQYPNPHAKVDVLIQEVSPGDDSTLHDLFAGRLSRLTKPPKQGPVAKGKIVGPRRALKKSMGLQALSTCNWWYGHPACGGDLNPTPGTIIALGHENKPNRVRVHVPSPPDFDNLLWNRGYFEVDGLRITIRKSFNDPDSGDIYNFDLREVPPPDWDGADCIINQGCDQTIAACRAHGREESFSGFGYGMPDRNPLFYRGP